MSSTRKFDKSWSQVNGDKVEEQPDKWFDKLFAVVFLAVCAFAGYVLITSQPKDVRKAQCENSETRRLISERRFLDGSVECTYVRNAPRTLKEIQAK